MSPRVVTTRPEVYMQKRVAQRTDTDRGRKIFIFAQGKRILLVCFRGGGTTGSIGVPIRWYSRRGEELVGRGSQFQIEEREGPSLVIEQQSGGGERDMAPPSVGWRCVCRHIWFLGMPGGIGSTIMLKLDL